MTALKISACLLLVAAAGCMVPAKAQENPEWARQDTIRFVEEGRVGKDTLRFTVSAPAGQKPYELFESMPVSASIFRKDWVVFFTGGMHTFRGDYSGNGDFSGTLSPEISGGIGYWFNPYVGLACEFIRSESEGYSEYITGHHGFGYGDILEKEDGTMYRKMKTSWWDTSLSVMLNLTRLINGYEGYGSLKHRNQFMLNLGMGCVHQLNYHQQYGTGYNWSGHAELQYSRFFGRKKRFSLDVKLRCLFYHTNFDYESKRRDRLIDRIDGNVGLHAGFTCYLGKLREKKKIKGLLSGGSYDYRGVPGVIKSNDVVEYRTLTADVAIPRDGLWAADSLSVGSLFRFSDKESLLILEKLPEKGTVTQVDLEIPNGNSEAETFAHAVEAWLKKQKCFQNAMFQTFRFKQPDSSEDSIKVKVHFLMNKKEMESTKQSI